MNVIKRLLIVLTTILCNLNSFSIQDSLKNNILSKFYIGWGYNRDWYSKGTVRLVNKNIQLINDKPYTYDFTLLNVKAIDRPQFNKIPDVINFTVPQFSARIGYMFNKKKDIGIELNYDHSKYVVIDYQKVHFIGTINRAYSDKDTILDPNTLLHFEHTDGANFLMTNFIKRWKILNSKKITHNLGVIVKPGIGIVIPRTDVTLFGNRVNNNWKISGIVAGLELGLRAEIVKHLYIEFTGKGGRANYINSIIQGKGNGKAINKFWFAEAIIIIGYQF